MPDSSISKEQLGKSCKLTRVTRFRWGKYRRAWWRALMTYLGSTGKPPCKRQRIEYQAQSPSVAHGVETRRRADEGMKQFIQQHKSAVPYVSQSFSWDCGLACTEMALRARGVKKVSFWDLRKSCSTNSVWSIDVAYLLRCYRVAATYFTVRKGICPEYRNHEFYRRSLPQDTKRVNRLFSNADRHGVRVVERAVPLSEIRDAIQRKQNLVLVLLDKRRISCSICNSSGFQNSRAIFSSSSSSGYLGHYVLLYAYNHLSDKFLMKDPSSFRETCVISASVLEHARSAFGTDQDIFFIGDREHGEKAE